MTPQPIQLGSGVSNLGCGLGLLGTAEVRPIPDPEAVGRRCHPRRVPDRSQK